MGKKSQAEKLTEQSASCDRRFELWWDATQGSSMKGSKYLARKAWRACWYILKIEGAK